MSVTYLEFPGRVLSVEVAPDVPGLIRRAVTVRVESGPPLAPAEYWRMSAAVAASLIALGYNVHSWEAIEAERPWPRRTPPMPEPTPVPDRTPARERFAVGDRVRATAAAVRDCLFRPGSPRTGEVVGFGVADDFCVRVRRDGQKSASTYSADYWEKDTGA